jgi:CheY-like chemotaxis protein
MLMKMQPIVKEALKLIRSTIPTTIEINQDINPDCGVIKSDPTQIHQIVMNLATNAYHAMEETGGELKVSLKQVESGEYDIITPDMTPGIYVCLTVADTGMGMDKNLTDKIFDPFFTTKEVGKGTGMGLSVVHGIVKGMGGSIHVYSEPGKGTQFNVYLPLAEAVKEQQVTNVEAPIQGGTEHILFVDDEELILQMETVLLERMGYQVTSRTSSIEALEAFRKNPDKFDMVITDMAMPNMSGDKLSVELIKIRPDIPVLLCTGFSENMSEEKAASMGIKGFLLKPIVIKSLDQKIREVLDEN